MGMAEEGDVLSGSLVEDFDYGVWVDWSSRHTSRGRDYLDGEGAFSQGAYFGLGHFGFEIARSGAMENGTEELNLDLSYYREFDRFSFYGAYEYSDWETNDFQVGGHSLEFGVTYFDLPGGFWIAGEVEYSIDREGFFSELSVGSDVELYDWLTLTPSVSVGFNSGYVDEGHDGLNHAVASLSADFFLTDQMKVTASAAYNWAINADAGTFPDDEILRDFFFTGLTVVIGGERGEGSGSSGSDWDLVFGTSVWATAFDGSISLGPGSPGIIRASAGDNDQLQTGLSLEAQRGRWSFLVDGSYVSFGAELPPPLPIFSATPVELRLAGVQLVAGYRGFESEKTSVDLMIGARYQHVESEYQFAVPESRELNWIDPTVGIRARVGLWEDWHVSGRADWGGFRVGSDQFWSVDLGVGYELSDQLSVELRYQHFEVDYADSDDVVDFTLKGLKLGVTYQF